MSTPRRPQRYQAMTASAELIARLRLAASRMTAYTDAPRNVYTVPGAADRLAVLQSDVVMAVFRLSEAADALEATPTGEAGMRERALEEALKPFGQVLVYSFEDDPGTIHVTYDGQLLAKLDVDSAEGTAALKLEYDLAVARAALLHEGQG